MIIAHISDTHIALDAADSASRLGDFERTIADINALDPAPDVIVHSGDIVHNGRADEYAAAKAILSKARAPVYVMAGNKDNRAQLREAFANDGYLAANSEFIAYAVEDFPIRLIALDTMSINSNRGDFGPERLSQLEAMTGADTSRPIAVFTHHPPFEVTVGPDPLHFESPEIMAELRQALQRSGRVSGVFSGHVHRAAKGTIGDIPAIVVPCIATALRKGEYPPAIKNCPVYYVHRFGADGRFSTQARVVHVEISRIR